MSLGSCFSENIGRQFSKFQFNIVVNPFGQQYNPYSIAQSLHRILENKDYSESELFQHSELWHSFHHHSDFSKPTAAETLQNINKTLKQAHQQLANADVLFLTFGTAHIFSLPHNGEIVSNCHKLPAKNFHKRMLTVDEIHNCLSLAITRILAFNPKIKVIATVSPVRYFAFGIEENTWSKSILFVALRTLFEKFPEVYYFPAYEIVMDELRDYRFFAEDMLHPNHQATQYVWEVLKTTLIEKDSQQTMDEVLEISRAANHKPRNPNSDLHRTFQQKYRDKAIQLVERFPDFNFSVELANLTSSQL